MPITSLDKIVKSTLPSFMSRVRNNFRYIARWTGGAIIVAALVVGGIYLSRNNGQSELETIITQEPVSVVTETPYPTATPEPTQPPTDIPEPTNTPLPTPTNTPTPNPFSEYAITHPYNYDNGCRLKYGSVLIMDPECENQSLLNLRAPVGNNEWFVIFKPDDPSTYVHPERQSAPDNYIPIEVDSDRFDYRGSIFSCLPQHIGENECLINILDNRGNILDTVVLNIEGYQTQVIGSSESPQTQQRVTIYEHKDYRGWSVSLNTGYFTLSDLQGGGFVNDHASSIKVPTSYRVTLYEHDNFEGASLIRTSNDSDFVNDGFNDMISSIIVELLESTPSQPQNSGDESPQPLQGGGVNFDAYCKAQGYEGVVLTEYSSNGWNCESADGSLHGIPPDLRNVCVWTYGGTYSDWDLYAEYYDPYSWECVPK